MGKRLKAGWGNLMVAMTAKFPVHAKGELSKIIFLADMSAKGGGQNPCPLLN